LRKPWRKVSPKKENFHPFSEIFSVFGKKFHCFPENFSENVQYSDDVHRFDEHGKNNEQNKNDRLTCNFFLRLF